MTAPLFFNFSLPVAFSLLHSFSSMILLFPSSNIPFTSDTTLLVKVKHTKTLGVRVFELLQLCCCSYGLSLPESQPRTCGPRSPHDFPPPPFHLSPFTRATATVSGISRCVTQRTTWLLAQHAPFINMFKLLKPGRLSSLR